MTDGDARKPRIGIVWKLRSQNGLDALLNAFEQTLVNGDADESGDNGLRGRLDVGGAGERVIAIGSLAEGFARAADDHRLQCVETAGLFKQAGDARADRLEIR